MKVGMTGHQSIGPISVVEWVSSTLDGQIAKYETTSGYTCLASGADQLFARLLQSKGIPYTVIIPSNEYEMTFSHSYELENYRSLLSSAKEQIQTSFGSPNEAAYYRAGREIVKQAEIIFAVWDGKRARGLGGTGDIVLYALQQRKMVIQINPVVLRVIELSPDTSEAMEVINAISQ